MSTKIFKRPFEQKYFTTISVQKGGVNLAPPPTQTHLKLNFGMPACPFYPLKIQNNSMCTPLFKIKITNFYIIFPTASKKAKGEATNSIEEIEMYLGQTKQEEFKIIAGMKQDYIPSQEAQQ